MTKNRAFRRGGDIIRAKFGSFEASPTGLRFGSKNFGPKIFLDLWRDRRQAFASD